MEISFWHNEIYKGVENTSVTPFSPNARDKALHVLLVILCKTKLNLESPKDIKNKADRARNEIIPIILDKVKKDAEYLKRHSFLFDLKILWLTILKVIRKDGVSH